MEVSLTVSDLGEIQLLKEIFIPNVSSNTNEINDDCAHFQANGNMLWSIDPCPTPMANWFDKATPEVWGCYTAIINLSDIAASGGTPIGMLVSLEIPDNTPVEFLKRYQSGLMAALQKADVKLLGGNVKSTAKFGATGTIIGTASEHKVTRHIKQKDCTFYLVGKSGRFWSSVIGNHYGWDNLPTTIQNELNEALCFPVPQTKAGQMIGSLNFEVACMDCSDGAANALFQLAHLNDLDITIYNDIQWDLDPKTTELVLNKNINLENIFYSFGDWQLACLVPNEYVDIFESKLNNFTITKLGYTQSGIGQVKTENNRILNKNSLNQNFSGGYNSINSIEDMISKFMDIPVFIDESMINQ